MPSYIVSEQFMDHSDYKSTKSGKGKIPRHTIRPKGVVNDIQKKSRALHFAMCDGLGIEPTPTRRETAAKLRGSIAYNEKCRIMREIQEARLSRVLDMEDDIANTQIVGICEKVKNRRRPITDRPCAPLVPGTVFPNKNSLPRKSFRDVLVW